jgi:hypothetical protein
MKRFLTAGFSALALAAVLAVSGCDKAPSAPSTPVHKSYISFNGDCYAEPKDDIQRCLTESTRGGGGAK